MLEPRPTIVVGGRTRNESTRNGLAALTDAGDDDIVVIHDAVRPLVPAEVVLRSIEPIMSGRADATDTVIPSADTLVVVEKDMVSEIPVHAGAMLHGCLWKFFRGESATLTNTLCDPGLSI